MRVFRNMRKLPLPQLLLPRVPELDPLDVVPGIHTRKGNHCQPTSAYHTSLCVTNISNIFYISYA